MKKYTIISMLIALVLVLSACSNTPTGQVVQEQQELKVGVLVYPGFGPVYVAEEKGFFEEENVNVEIISSTDPLQLTSLLASGEIDVMFGSVDFAVILEDSGIDVETFLITDIGYGADGVLVKDDVKEIQDLKGKTIHLLPGTPSYFLLRYVTEKEGLTNTDFQTVEMDPDQVGAAFIAEQLDYGISWEPWLSQAAEREDGYVLFSSADYPIILDTFLATKQTLENREQEIKGFSKAWFKAIDYGNANPEESDAIIAEAFGIPVEDYAMMSDMVKPLTYSETMEIMFSTDEFGASNLASEASRIYYEDEIISQRISSEDILDQTFLATIYN